MTRNYNTTNISTLFDQIGRTALGFETIFEGMDQTTSYPPYNVVKNQDGVISLEIAVAGFKQSEISIEKHQQQLTVEGEKEPVEGEELDYQHKGISNRNFKLTWKLAEYLEVTDASMEDGIITIVLELDLPEAAKPRQIELNKGKLLSK